MNRRDFIKLSAMAGAAAAMEDSKGFAQQEVKATVALVKSNDRPRAVKKAIALLGINPVRGKNVVLKPNFNSAHAFPGSTHNDTLKAIIERLSDMGASSFTVADRSGMGNTRSVIQQKGVLALAQEMEFTPVVLDELPGSAWQHFEMKDTHWSRGLFFPRMFSNAESIVQTCCLKTHRYGGHFTLSLKNSVGMVAKYSPVDGFDFMNQLHSSANQRLMIAEINLLYKPDLIVLDGIEAFVKEGPDQGTLARPGIVVAGTDRVAVDAVGVAVLRLYGTTPEVTSGTIFNQAQIKRAVELGIGIDAPEKIETVVADNDSLEFAQRLTPYLGLSARVLGQPELSIRRSQNEVVISWPTAEGHDYTLMGADSLSADPPQWSPVQAQVMIEDAHSSVTLPIDKAQSYYRLAKQSPV